MSKTFGRQVKATRERKGWSQDRLAAELERMNEPMDRATIARIEAGKRGVSVDDLIVFALALGVAPVYLLLPRAEPQVELAGGFSVGGWEALAWMRGLFPIIETDDVNTAIADPDVRFFYESCPDFEDAAIRRNPLVHELWLNTSLAMSYTGLSDRPHKKLLASTLRQIIDVASVALAGLETKKRETV